MSERPARLADWPTEWEFVLGSRPGTFFQCRSCGTEEAPRRRCYEKDGTWVAEYGIACPNPECPGARGLLLLGVTGAVTARDLLTNPDDDEE